MKGLPDIAQRLLSELEEARFELIITLLVTITPNTGAPEELANFQFGAKVLLGRDFITMTGETTTWRDGPDLSKAEAMALVGRLPEMIAVDPNLGRWRLVDNPGPPFTKVHAGIVPTDAGLALARQILEVKGYKYWTRPRRSALKGR